MTKTIQTYEHLPTKAKGRTLQTKVETRAGRRHCKGSPHWGLVSEQEVEDDQAG